MNLTILRIFLILCLMIGGGANAFAANDVITLQIPGFSGDAQFAASLGLAPDAIETLSVASGVSHSSTGVRTFSPFQIIKHFGASSAQFFLSVANEGHILDATISFYHQDRGGLTKYFEIDLAGVDAQSQELTGSEAHVAARDVEQLTLAYRSIKLKDLVAGTTACFNVVQNATC